MLKRSALWIIGTLFCFSSNAFAIEFELLAGQDIDAGTVLLYQVGDEIRLKIYAEDGWSIKETHVEVACDPYDFPLTKCCNPKVGQFLYVNEDYLPGTTEEVLTIPLTGPESPALLCNLPGQRVYFAVHAVVVHPELGEETAWGGCYCDNPNAPKIYTLCDKRKGNWAEYFWFDVN